jgi:MFS family permease
MGRHRHHLIGLSRSSMSLSYIVGPVMAGFSAQLLGDFKTFSLIGFLGVFLILFLLIKTPKKLHLPQQNIHMWD